ncbi:MULTISPECIES: antiviral RADAR system adenosine deaminase RdrB [Pectobacterium]|uniref:antiviral RADAR system adenosine deaminase RdrB n=1 Tax=Pectobacterium TaxID=122277 RepID=UPI002A827D3D|nr:antiviral RADAR system adenosine deaminase RdrB [Pectobacterium brasiliense]MDY4347644.1 antiviral RADAR system adenosine deaminase RdrB [Pectobacterium brasiliense]
MYNQDPRWLIPATYLTSDRLFNYWLKQHLQKEPCLDDHLDNERRALSLAAQDYQFYFGGSLRKEDIKGNAELWELPSGTLGSLGVLAKLADHFLVWVGDCFEVRREKLEAWIMLCSIIDPAWVIVISYVRLMDKGVLSEHELIATLTGRQCAFAFPRERNDAAYADNHVHFNGHGYSSLSMLSFINGDCKLKKDLKWPRREEYTLFESELLNKNKLPDFFAGYVACLLSCIYGESDRKEYKRSSKSINYTLLNDAIVSPSSVHIRLLHDFTQIYEPSTLEQRLLHISMQPHMKGHHRWMLFCAGLMFGNHRADYLGCLNNFIRVSHVLRNYMVVSAVGLGQFVEFFGFDARRQDKTLFNKEVTRFDIDNNTFREYRVSPDVVLGNGKKENIYHHKLIDFYSSHEKQSIPEHAHLVVHFTRGLPDKKHPYDRRVQGFRAKLLKQTRAFEAFSASVTIKETPYTRDEYNSEPHNVDLRRLVRGYDVAGNENELPIEVFAPVLRVLRAAKHPGGMSMSTRLQRPFITVHSGEDYSHLLSGLRAMDEAVEFCQLREGDRLGHGLALGIDVNHWAHRQRRAYLTAGQHLDNMVWAYHQAVQLSQHTVEHIPVMHELRDKIHHWSQLLYKDVCTPNLLYRAWLLRRNWPDYEDMQSDMTNFSEWAPDGEWLLSDDAVDAHKARIFWQRYLDSGIEKEKYSPFNQVISVNCQPDVGELFSTHISDKEDILSQGEIRLYEAIQDFLMEKYSRLGLVIEACPTSNIYIGRFEKYHEHPLFRWNPPQPEWLKPGEKFNRYGLRSGPLAVCINTDDSALMPTTIANEHRLMRETAIQCYNIGAWMADLWIDSIRQKGVDIFRANHLSQTPL